MIARIDSKDKTIAIEEQVTADELIKFLKFIDPTGWKQWKVNTNVKFEITSTPIVIRERDYPYMPSYPANPPYPNQPFWYASPTLCDSEGISTISVSDHSNISFGDKHYQFVDFQAQG